MLCGGKKIHKCKKRRKKKAKNLTHHRQNQVNSEYHPTTHLRRITPQSTSVTAVLTPLHHLVGCLGIFFLVISMNNSVFILNLVAAQACHSQLPVVLTTLNDTVLVIHRGRETEKV